MKLVPLTVALASFLGISTAFGQAPDATGEFAPYKAKIVAGKTATVQLRITFAPGYHGYQNPPTEDFEIPVKVTIGKESSFKWVSAKYPEGKPMDVAGTTKPTRVYSDTITIPITVKAPAKPGAATLAVQVDYQQCDANSCLPPSSFVVKKQLQVYSASGASGSGKATKSKKAAR